MADGVTNISGYGNYNLGAYASNQRKNNVNDDGQENVGAKSYEETQVDPEKVMDFLAQNNFFVAPVQTPNEVGKVDIAQQDRVAGYMEAFEMIYGIVLEEFGEEYAPAVMDLVMDRLIGMAE